MMSFSTSYVGAVDFGFGRVYKMNLLFAPEFVRRILSYADEEDFDPCFQAVVPNGYIPVDGISSEMLDSYYDFECSDERDDRIFGDEDGDPVNPNGDPLDILIAAEESAAKYCVGWDAEDYAFLHGEPMEALDVDGITFGQASQQRLKTLLNWEEDRYVYLMHKVTSYGPHGKQLVKHVPYESHGAHGRKRTRPKHVTVRGARVRADIFSSTRCGPRCVGLVATPRKCT